MSQDSSVPSSEQPSDILFEPPFEPWYTLDPHLLKQWLCSKCQGVEIPHPGIITSSVISIPEFKMYVGLRKLPDVPNPYPSTNLFSFNLPLFVPEARFREGVKWFTDRGCTDQGGPSQSLATLMVPHPEHSRVYIASIKLTSMPVIKQ